MDEAVVWIEKELLTSSLCHLDAEDTRVEYVDTEKFKRPSHISKFVLSIGFVMSDEQVSLLPEERMRMSLLMRVCDADLGCFFFVTKQKRHGWRESGWCVRWMKKKENYFHSSRVPKKQRPICSGHWSGVICPNWTMQSDAGKREK